MSQYHWGARLAATARPTAVVGACLTAMAIVAGCVNSPAERRDEVYLSAPFASLLEGVMDGPISFGELRRHGNLGLGTVDDSDGELVVLNGESYTVKVDGSVHRLKDSQETPWAMVTYFEPDKVLTLNEELDLAQLRKKLDEVAPEPNLPYAFRIHGTFPYVKTRSIARQSPPYRRLLEVVKEQTIFELKNVSGTIVGFRLPEYLSGLGVPGYHLHFLTTQRSAGGHLVDFRSSRLSVELDRSTSVAANIPTDPAFAQTPTSPKAQAEMDQIMGRAPLRRQ